MKDAIQINILDLSKYGLFSLETVCNFNRIRSAFVLVYKNQNRIQGRENFLPKINFFGTNDTVKDELYDKCKKI